MKLTDTQLLDLIEKHHLEVSFGGDAPRWRVWLNDCQWPSYGSTLRAALTFAHTELVAKTLHPEI